MLFVSEHIQTCEPCLEVPPSGGYVRQHLLSNSLNVKSNLKFVLLKKENMLC